MRKLSEIRKEFLSQKPIQVTNQLLEELQIGFEEENKMNKRKAEFLFEMKEKAKGNIPPAFEKWFVDQITRYLLEDGDSVGEIDSEEGSWLQTKVRHHDKYDEKLLDSLEDQLEEIGRELPGYLKKKSMLVRKFENILYASRYVALISVVGAIISSIILFIQGFGLIIRGLIQFFNDPEEKYEMLFEQLVSSVDVFLFALVLIIFGVGVYELFISNNNIDDASADSPAWLKIKSVDDLKSALGKVILMVLIVSFFKHVLEISTANWTPLALLYLSIGILLIGITLYLTHKSNAEEAEEKRKTVKLSEEK